MSFTSSTLYLDTPVQTPMDRIDWGAGLPEGSRFKTLILEADQYVKALFSEPCEFDPERDFMEQLYEGRIYRDRELQVMVAMLYSLRRVARIKGTEFVLGQLESRGEDLIDDICVDMSEFGDVDVANLAVHHRYVDPYRNIRPGVYDRKHAGGMYFDLRPISREEVTRSMDSVRSIEARYAQAIFQQPHLVDTGNRGPDALRRALWLYWPVDADIQAEFHRQRILSQERRNWVGMQEFWCEHKELARQQSFEEWMREVSGRDRDDAEITWKSLRVTYLTRWVLSYLKYMHMKSTSVSRSRMVDVDRVGGDEYLLTEDQTLAWQRMVAVSMDHHEILEWLDNCEPAAVQALAGRYDLHTLVEYVLDHYSRCEVQEGQPVDRMDFVRTYIRKMIRMSGTPDPGFDDRASRNDLQYVLRKYPLGKILERACCLQEDLRAVLYFNMGYADHEFYKGWREVPTVRDFCWYYGMTFGDYYRILHQVIDWYAEGEPMYVQGSFPGMSAVNAEVDRLNIKRAFWGTTRIGVRVREIEDLHCGIHDGHEWYEEAVSGIKRTLASVLRQDYVGRASMLAPEELSVLRYLRGDFDDDIRRMGNEPNVAGACVFLRMTEYMYGDALERVRCLFDPRGPSIPFQHTLPGVDGIELLNNRREEKARLQRMPVVRKKDDSTWWQEQVSGFPSEGSNEE